MRRVEQDFHRRHPVFVLTHDQPLRNDGFHVLRQIHKNLCLLLDGVHVDNPVQRFRCVIGVQGRDRQVARAGQR